MTSTSSALTGDEDGRRRSRRRGRAAALLVSASVFVALAGIWQILSYAFPSKGVSDTPLVPGWGWIVTRAFPSIANYGGNGFGLSEAQGGSQGTYWGAVVVLFHNSLDTWGRLLVGLAAGALIGTGLAVAVSWSRIARLGLALPAHILRTVPLLAMIPLFELWFGTSFTGVVIFIAFGTGIIFFSGTLNAVGNIPTIYVENARSLGASSFQIYRDVILPGVFPELRTAIMLGLGVAWSAVVGAEFLGTQSGLGYIEAQARQFALLDRMFVVALLFFAFAAGSYLIFEFLTRPLVAWMPRMSRE